ncbi:MAG: hypothetical protein ACLR23_28460 [Clostridia bacterium]
MARPISKTPAPRRSCPWRSHQVATWGCARGTLSRCLLMRWDLPIIVDAGIGRPSQACEAMEMGAAAVLVDTAVATAQDPAAMAAAFKLAVESGRQAYLA